jgi:hypothetical protein
VHGAKWSGPVAVHGAVTGYGRGSMAETFTSLGEPPSGTGKVAKKQSFAVWSDEKCQATSSVARMPEKFPGVTWIQESEAAAADAAARAMSATDFMVEVSVRVRWTALPPSVVNSGFDSLNYF